MTTSEEKYWIADKLYDRIKLNFYEIENEEPSNIDKLIDETMDDAEEALEILEGINMKVIKKLYPGNIDILTKNVSKFKEQADFVLSILKKVKNYHPEQRHPLPPEMWPDKEREEHEEQLRKRREAAVEEKPVKWDEFELGESFISLKEYKEYKNKE
jgi:hypothetical protein